MVEKRFIVLVLLLVPGLVLFLFSRVFWGREERNKEERIKNKVRL
jgi:hypothetical protein